MSTVISLFLICALVGIVVLFTRAIETKDALHREERQAIYTASRLSLEKKDQRIVELDADYKALAESYAREVGKVWIRPPSIVASTNLPPAQPNPWRMKPPPPLGQIKKDK